MLGLLSAWLRLVGALMLLPITAKQLSSAVHNNEHTATVALLLAHGADSNVSNSVGNTALMSAAKNGNLDIVELLLSHGADVHARDRRNYTAIIFAATFEHTQTV
jgi:ankyrin repeat protein